MVQAGVMKHPDRFAVASAVMSQSPATAGRSGVVTRSG
jgi:hypothetical protein